MADIVEEGHGSRRRGARRDLIEVRLLVETKVVHEILTRMMLARAKNWDDAV